MDFQYWLYIIIGIIYLISQFRKKSEPQDENTGVPNAERNRAPGERPLSFEELLKEITQGKSPERKPVAANPIPQRPVVATYNEDEDEEERSIEKANQRYRTENRYYEDAKTLAFNRPSLEETMKHEDTDMRFGRFMEFEDNKVQNLATEYLEEFKNPTSLKKAIVMSEILQRKF